VKTTRTLVALAVVLGLAMLPATAVAQGGYSPVTDQRLVKPEPENWLQIRGNYQGWGYSPLGQITANNVKKLTPVWAFSTGVGSGHEAPPIVNNGVMFVATPYSQVIALEAKTGKLIWRYKRELPEDFKALHNTSRGIALFGDKVYVASLDCSGRPRRQDRQGRLGKEGRGLPHWLLHDARPARGEGQGHGRRVRRRVRRPGLRSGL